MNIIECIREWWGWIGIQPDEILFENDFGNLIIKDIHGKYWRLCPEEVYCKVIAENHEEFEILSTDSDFIEDWSMESLVEQAREKLGALIEGKKYYLVVPGPMGGKYETENIKTVSFTELISISGNIGKQINELTDGTSIQLKLID